MKVNCKINQNIVSLDYKLRNTETYKIEERNNIFTLSIFKKPQWTKGITSMCRDLKHIIFLDYDNIARFIVEQELRQLQKQFNLTPFYLFTTKEEIKDDGIKWGNYHAISLTKKNFQEVLEILKYTSCDINYKTMPFRKIFRSWVLRVGIKKHKNKPIFLDIINFFHKDEYYESLETMNNEISNAHLLALQRLYNIPNLDYTKKDNYSKIFVNDYETS